MDRQFRVNLDKLMDILHLTVASVMRCAGAEDSHPPSLNTK